MQFFCTNCNIISEVSKIGIDEKKRDKSKDIQKKIEDLEFQIKKEEERGWLTREGYVGIMRMDVLEKTILKREYETKYKYIECTVCKKRHYIEEPLSDLKEIK